MSNQSAPSGPPSTPRSGPPSEPVHSWAAASPSALPRPYALPPIIFHSVDHIPARLYAHASPPAPEDSQQWRLLQRSHRTLTPGDVEPPLRRSHSAGADLSSCDAPPRPRAAEAAPARSFSAALTAAPPPVERSAAHAGDATAAATPRLHDRERRESLPPGEATRQHDVVAAERINEEVRKMGRTLSRESGEQSHFTVQTMLGRGAFGTVYRGMPCSQRASLWASTMAPPCSPVHRTRQVTRRVACAHHQCVNSSHPSAPHAVVSDGNRGKNLVSGGAFFFSQLDFKHNPSF